MRACELIKRPSRQTAIHAKNPAYTAHEKPWAILKERSRYPRDNDRADECAQKIGNNNSSDLKEADGIFAIVKTPVAGILKVDS